MLWAACYRVKYANLAKGIYACCSSLCPLSMPGIAGNHHSYDVNAVIFLVPDGLGVMMQQPEGCLVLLGGLVA